MGCIPSVCESETPSPAAVKKRSKLQLRISRVTSMEDESPSNNKHQYKRFLSGAYGDRLEIEDSSLERPRTGEEAAYEMDETGEIGDGKLGLISEEEVIDILANLEPGQLYEDPDFPAASSSLFYSERSPAELNQYTWRRPFELAENPSIYVDGTSRKDVIQGVLGDCWLLSTCAAIAKREDLLHRICPPEQPLSGSGYTGLIRIRIWRYGHWETVHIDDRLPQKNGDYCFSHCHDRNEFWVALVEKAMAKLHGSYEAIEGGMPIEAMVDLTGGLAERYELKSKEMGKTLYRYLRRSFAAQSFITCSRRGDWRQAYKADKNGLVQGHAYTITGLYRVDTEKFGRVHLIRVRNPWGDKSEWTGAWSDNHTNWRYVPEYMKKAMGLHNLFDGEFWMEFFTDFCREFEEVSICTLGPDFNQDGQVEEAQSVKVIFGDWQLDDGDGNGSTAGGCRNDLDKFATNPQFLLTLTEADDEMEEDANHNHGTDDPKCHVIISLAQEHRRSYRDQKVKLLQIGFCIYRTSDGGGGSNPHKRLDAHHFMYHRDQGSSGPYINYREVFARFDLSPGSYVIVPATFEPDCEGRFMIRVYAHKDFDLRHIAQ